MVDKIYTKLLAAATMGSELVDCANTAACAIGNQHHDVRVRSRQFGRRCARESFGDESRDLANRLRSVCGNLCRGGVFHPTGMRAEMPPRKPSAVCKT
jgi:hypothetical protein